jgi:putative CocE/NonD family hydrolase
MRSVEQFPRKIEMLDDIRIPLSDGTTLAARIWRPVDAMADPVPAILEYLPYRRRDGTAERDAMTHPYFAGHGYAAVRVDIRGTGDSDGIILGEYLKQEQDDALEIIAWIAGQPWCSGSVGMIGISWGGFNGLQVAARRPPALKAVVSIASTDDRYADDIHFMGGCLLTDKLGWGSTIFSINSAPPDPAVVGQRWREMWLQRLEKDGLWLLDWLRHQRRDALYKHGSICEDWAAIQCPVYAVGGWADGYTNAVFRLLANLKSPSKGLVGPWAHKYPHFAMPGPAIGFLQECLRWWDQWLKGKETGIMEEPRLRVWLEDPAPPLAHHPEKPGRWVAEASWPSPRISDRHWRLERGRLAEAEPGKSEAKAKEGLALRSPQTVGLTAGSWCPYGLGHDQSIDQRPEAGGSLVFDTPPLAADIEVLGAPVVELEVSSDRPNAFLACTLSEILPDGAVSRVSYGLLNLTHRESHEHPTPLDPGKRYRIQVQLRHCGHRFAAGTQIRLAVSTSYWPIAWPSPEAATVTLQMGSSGLRLPVRPPRAEDKDLAPFAPPESSPKLGKTQLEPGWEKRSVTQDRVTGEVVWELSDSDGTNRIEETGLIFSIRRHRRMSIHPDDPTSARLELDWHRSYSRGDWRVSSECSVTLTSTRETFQVTARLDAYEGRSRVFSRNWEEMIPRDLV